MVKQLTIIYFYLSSVIIITKHMVDTELNFILRETG